MIYIYIIIMILLIIIVLSGIYFLNITLNPKTKDYDATYDIEVNSGYIDKHNYENKIKEEIYIDSDFGYKLHGIYFPNGDSKKTIIICHGYTYTLYGSIKYMDMFYKRGYNVLVYDHRYHGKSGGKNSTFGYYEKFDLKSFVDYIIKKNGQEGIIGTHGESMGAATVLQHAFIDKRLTFVIADCPFQNVKEQFKYRLKIEYKLPSFPILNVSSLITKLRIKANYNDISPINGIGSINTPILFIHGDSDSYIPYTHSVNMYEKKKGAKMLYIAKGADHAKSFAVDKKEYEKKVNEFLDSIKNA